MKINLNNDWGFIEQFDSVLHTAAFDQATLEKVRLPHSCIETPYNCFDEGLYQMNMGYRKVLHAPPEWQGKIVQLTFQGAAHLCEVFIGGQSVCKHLGGYTAFSCDIGPYLSYGQENILVVRVDSRESLNMPPFGYVIDYMTYGGLYREAYLEVLPQQHLEDVFVQTENVNEESAKLVLELTLNTFQQAQEIKVTLQSLQTHEEVPLGNCLLNAKTTTIEFDVTAIDPWCLETPNLYQVIFYNLQGEKIKQVRFGFRQITLDSSGVYLNGKRLKLRGLNRHQSYPFVGYAMPAAPQRLDADILKKELGVNAVRTSHYPQSHHFIDRCDEIGLLVFTEIPGWQHIGDEAWKKCALDQVSEMVLQYRNHPSIFIWGVRINESMDDDTLYLKTNQLAKKLDPTRPTGGVRYIKKSHLLEDVYTYNDFYHNGKNSGLEGKNKVSSNQKSPYMVTEFNGHMFPTKSFDNEGHRLSHALRHAQVLDDFYKYPDILGAFGWCMFDYNTHKDFGSGDRICYHGVLDMFRNPKPAASVYASQQEESAVLEISSSMEVGEYPGSFRGDVYAFTNADEVRVYKNDQWIQTFVSRQSPYGHLPHGPILMDDFVGNLLETGEGFSKKKSQEVKKLLMAVSKYGPNNLPLEMKFLAAKIMLWHRMSFESVAKLYTKYIGDWGQTATRYRFEAVQAGKVTKLVEKGAMDSVDFIVDVDHTKLIDGATYDVATIRIRAVSDLGNLLSYYQESMEVELEGPIEGIGPRILTFRGGMTGTYVKTKGVSGQARVKLSLNGVVLKSIDLSVTVQKDAL